MRLNEKVVLITGASEGIGAACIDAFRKRGSHLVLTARREERLQCLAQPGDLVIAADLFEEESRERIMAETIRHFGRIDVLINNAGAGLYQPSHLSSMADARRLMELNFFAPLALSQLAAAHMKKQSRGSIVNVASIAAKLVLPWFTLYSASKSALVSLTDGMRMELAAYGIHCMSVCPGYVRTRFQMNVLAGTPPALGSAMRRWSITREACAEAIAKGIEDNARTVMIPQSGWFLVGLRSLFPVAFDRQIEAVSRKQLPPS